MAINLWEVGGKPTSYNPLPTGWSNYIRLDPGTYIIKFKAKSPINSVLWVTTESWTYLHKEITLTNDLQEYIFEFTASVSQAFHFTDNNVASKQLIIQDINLVQKPLGQATINGLDGFLSGKWSAFTNSNLTPITDGSKEEAINDSTIKLTFSSDTWKQKTVTMECEPNTQYSISADYISDKDYPWNLRIDGTTPFINGSYPRDQLKNGMTFTTSPTSTSITIFIQSNRTHEMTISKLIVNKGLVPAPYEPKRGERMVMPRVAGDNLLPPFYAWTKHANAVINGPYDLTLNATAGNQVTSYTIDAEEGQTFSVSLEKTGVHNLEFLDANNTKIGSTLYINTVTAPAGTKWLKLGVYSNGAGTFTFKNPMLVTGPLAKPFEPYRVQTSRKATRTTPINGVPEKNLIPGFNSGKWSYYNQAAVKIISGTEIEVTTSALYQSNDIVIDVIPGEKYTLSGIVTNAPNSILDVRNKANNTTLATASAVQSDGYVKATFTPTENQIRIRTNNVISATGKYNVSNIQFEKADVKTPYESYKEVSRPANSPVRQAFR